MLPPSQALCWLSIAVAVVCLGGQLASFAHLALVEHVRCSQHGELVHRNAGSGDAPDSDSHDHCVLAAHRSAVFSVEHGAVQVAPASAIVVEAPGARSESPAPPIPLVLLAPKQSPPA
jgi:hypothetical protein